MARSRRPQADEHPRPQVTVPLTIFGDPFFVGNAARVGRFVHYWCAAVWKKDPSFFFPEVEEDLHDGTRYGWVIHESGRPPRLTGPRRDPGWLLDARRSWFTYAIRTVGADLVKIGRTTDVERRLEELQCASPHALTLVGCIEGDHEARIHRDLQNHHVGGEWFRLTPSTEILRRHGIEVG